MDWHNEQSFFVTHYNDDLEEPSNEYSPQYICTNQKLYDDRKATPHGSCEVTVKGVLGAVLRSSEFFETVVCVVEPPQKVLRVTLGLAKRGKKIWQEMREDADILDSVCWMEESETKITFLANDVETLVRDVLRVWDGRIFNVRTAREQANHKRTKARLLELVLGTMQNGGFEMTYRHSREVMSHYGLTRKFNTSIELWDAWLDPLIRQRYREEAVRRWGK